jgi:molecular chaperone GrpE (heat shock protein)
MGVPEIKKKIEELRDEIQRLDREDRRNLAYMESLRKKAQQRVVFLKKLAAGSVLEEAGVLDNYDEAVLKKLLVEHREEITGGMNNG